jgi:hypothetical protein
MEDGRPIEDAGAGISRGEQGNHADDGENADGPERRRGHGDSIQAVGLATRRPRNALGEPARAM